MDIGNNRVFDVIARTDHNRVELGGVCGSELRVDDYRIDHVADGASVIEDRVFGARVEGAGHVGVVHIYDKNLL